MFSFAAERATSASQRFLGIKIERVGNQSIRFACSVQAVLVVREPAF